MPSGSTYGSGGGRDGCGRNQGSQQRSQGLRAAAPESDDRYSRQCVTLSSARRSQRASPDRTRIHLARGSFRRRRHPPTHRCYQVGRTRLDSSPRQIGWFLKPSPSYTDMSPIQITSGMKVVFQAQSAVCVPRQPLHRLFRCCESPTRQPQRAHHPAARHSRLPLSR
jgi:hypothetical protein